ncbi:cysteine desulfurase [Paraoerskovia marina]|uniref:Cysteine desulfurase n=1 Tax=Paraoerskovia marina TaxID=545619 RepID=A0A1H1S6Y8_9CELL|nr:aminotransferase class V-fold PLP-dependent enzyme [Paraoerskovia marina]SDS43747.1 cysteine desulfurase [Paraoerskovia marina]
MTESPPRTLLDASGNATLHPLAREAYVRSLADGWADPRRLHAEGRRARALLDGARESLAASLGVRTQEIHLAPNHVAAIHAGVLAIRGGRRRRGQAVVLPAVERAAVRHAAAHPLPGSDAPATVVDVPVQADGRVDTQAFLDAVAAPGVALACLQHANGEVGTVQPLEQAVEACAASGVPLLCDAGATIGHLPAPGGWDALAADPADWGAGPGVGVLAVRARTRTRSAWPEDDEAWFPGGVSIPAAFAAAVALEAVLGERAAEAARQQALIDQIRACATTVPDTQVVGDPVTRLPHVVTFSCLYVDGEALVTELDRRGFAVGSGSACTSSTLEPSHVLAAMGVLTHGNVRVSLDRTTTADDVARFCAELPDAVATVRDALGVNGL